MRARSPSAIAPKERDQGDRATRLRQPCHGLGTLGYAFGANPVASQHHRLIVIDRVIVRVGMAR
jgi:hypothetical protein